jgi:hypothetical protein
MVLGIVFKYFEKSTPDRLFGEPLKLGVLPDAQQAWQLREGGIIWFQSMIT